PAKRVVHLEWVLRIVKPAEDKIMNSFEDPSQEPGHETGGGKEFGLTPEQTEALRANTQEILSNRFLPRLYASYMQEPYGWLPDIWDYYRGNDENTRRLV